MKITKIKIDKKTQLAEIIYNVSNCEYSKEVKFSGAEEPRQEFIDAFQNMGRHLVSVLKFLDGFQEDITITGLSITYDDDVNLMGMVITAQLQIEGLNAPMNINTPFITFASYELDNENRCVDLMYSAHCEANLKQIFDYAEKYMNGESKNCQLKLTS